MSEIQTKFLHHAALPGVHVLPLGGKPERGSPQKILVIVEPGAEIPLHSHEGDANMHILAGAGNVLSDDETNGAPVQPGDCVFFARLRAHGFKAAAQGLAFLSENEGIVDADPRKWDLEMV